MKPVNWLALSAAFTGGVIALGIHTFRHPVETQMAAKTKARGAVRARPLVVRPEMPLPARPVARVEKLAAGGASPSSRNAVLSETEWRAQAARVEIEATHELNRLVELLDLDPVQQGQVFSVLARNSPSWLPGMKTTADPASPGNKAKPAARDKRSGPPPAAGPVASTEAESPPSPEERDLTVFLSPEQQQALIREEMDRQAWWAEVLPQLLPPVIPSVGETALPPDIKAYDGSAVLLEE